MHPADPWGVVGHAVCPMSSLLAHLHIAADWFCSGPMNLNAGQGLDSMRFTSGGWLLREESPVCMP